MDRKRNRSRISETDRCPFLNVLHAIILVILLVYTIHGIYIDAKVESTGNFFQDILNGLLSTGATEIFTFIGCVAFIAFGLMGIYEFAYSYGIRPLYPPIYGVLRERRDTKAAEIMMKTYYENDKEFLQNFEKERFDSILKALKIDVRQYKILSYELIRARSMPDETIEQLQEKAKIIALNEEFVINLSNFQDSRVYSDVNYFVNLYNAAYIDDIRNSLGKIMAQYINLKMKPNIQEIDYIVIPHNSNLLLGLTVGKLLGKPIIYIQDKPRIIKEQYWDGDYKLILGHTNQIIILHDVLVTGNRIADAVNKLTPDTFDIRGFFCVVKYDHPSFQPENKLKDVKIESDIIHCLLTTSETELKDIFKNDKTKPED